LTTEEMKKSPQRDANTARALAVACSKVRTPPARPPAPARHTHTHTHTHTQTDRQDRLQYTALQLASAQCNHHISVVFRITLH